ncbi:tetratricopeptide repeat protein [Crenothrix sp.]|uniref:tetratricopeptide repeat protein n=1 Tax=Crenothrix sp. TaxID=3100433 RepID=UPI00374D9068
MQGKLFFDPKSNGQWQPAQLNELLCEGSRIRVDVYSRALIQLPSGIVLRLFEGTVLSLNEIAPQKAPLLNMVKGFVHFISRTPKRLLITTPIANAGPEGTEFALRVNENNASLWVYEGGVKFFNTQGSVSLKPGQGAQAQLGQAPKAQIDIKPQDAVNWALYYPPILPYPDAATVIDADIRTAIEEFRQGHVDVALSRLDALATDKQTPYFFKVRAAIRLTVGLDQLALQDIKALLANNPHDAEALALQSIRSLTQNRKDEAYALANRAVAADPHSATAYSALSYAAQGRFELDKALQAANKATLYAPHDAMVWARKAEIELALGLTSESKQTAQRASGLDASLERTQTVMGFSHLISMDTNEALQSFERAVKLDSSSPLARLGLGLAKIRNGDLQAGRQDLEIAAILDPGNSLIRSYLGKAYYEENRNSLAEDQFSLAKQRDPKDPTPYFYDALKKQTENRPVEALQDLQKAMALNDNRAVYRSKQLLDSDRAARGASLARIYDTLGFEQRGIVEATSSLQIDPTNFSAHRFLSDTYVDQQGKENAQLSELLQAKLLQPININPVQPHLSVSQRGSLNASGIANSSLQDFTRIYERNRPQLLLSGIGGSQNSFGDEAILSGIYNKFSYSLGQFHFGTDGINVDNLSQINKQDSKERHNIYDAFIQSALGDHLDLQLEYLNRNSFLNKTNQPNRNPGSLNQEIVRTGLHFKPNKQLHILGLYTHINSKNTQFHLEEKINTNDPDSGSFSSLTKTIGELWQGQLILSNNTYNITSGFNRYKIGNIQTDTVLRNNRSFTYERPDQDGFNLYAYSLARFIDKINLTLGLSYDQHDPVSTIPGYITKLNPKIGLQWDLNNNAKFRMAYFSSYNKPLLVRDTLEQTQVTGFNQIFDDFNNRNFDFYGVALDFFWPGLFSGIEFYRRDSFTFDNNYLEKLDNSNDRFRFYFYYAINNNFSLSSEYKYEKNNFLVNGINTQVPTKYYTHKLPIEIRYFNSNGLFMNLKSTWVLQNELTNLPNSYFEFVVFDAGLGYRLPKRKGILSLEIKNLFNNRVNYKNITRFTSADIFNNNLEFFNDRTILGRITINF